MAFTLEDQYQFIQYSSIYRLIPKQMRPHHISIKELDVSVHGGRIRGVNSPENHRVAAGTNVCAWCSGTEHITIDCSHLSVHLEQTK